MTLRRMAFSLGSSPGRTSSARRSVGHTEMASDLLLCMGPRRVPVERSHAPEICERGCQNSNEDENFSVASPTKFAARDRPEKDEDRLQIENDKEHRDQVELDG